MALPSTYLTLPVDVTNIKRGFLKPFLLSYLIYSQNLAKSSCGFFDQFTNKTKFMKKKKKKKKPLVTCILVFYNFFIFLVFCPKNWKFLEIFSFYDVNSNNFEKTKKSPNFRYHKIGRKKRRKRNPWNLQGPNLIKPDNSFH
jgi:hypothetical protein